MTTWTQILSTLSHSFQKDFSLYLGEGAIHEYKNLILWIEFDPNINLRWKVSSSPCHHPIT